MQQAKLAAQGNPTQANCSSLSDHPEHCTRLSHHLGALQQTQGPDVVHRSPFNHPEVFALKTPGLPRSCINRPGCNDWSVLRPRNAQLH